MNLIDFDRVNTFEDFCKETGITGKAALELLITELHKIQEQKRKKQLV